jgi:hypothetical protein
VRKTELKVYVNEQDIATDIQDPLISFVFSWLYHAVHNSMSPNTNSTFLPQVALFWWMVKTTPSKENGKNKPQSLVTTSGISLDIM